MNPRQRVLLVFAVFFLVAAFLAFERLREEGPGAAEGEPEAAVVLAPPAPRTGRPASVGIAAARAAVAAPGPVSPGAEGPAGGVFARAAWGSGPGQLGRERPQEGNPEAPMSLTLDAEGRVVVLDQVNGRVVRFHRDGTSDSVPLPLQAPQDVAVAKNGALVVIDRLVDKSVAIVEPGGKVLGELPLEGKGVAEAGGVTALVTDGDDVWVESEHAGLVRIGDANGAVDDKREEAPGRPTRDGRSWVNAAITDGPSGRVRVTLLDRATGAHRYTRELRVNTPVYAIVLLDSDAEGFLYLAVLTIPDEQTPESARIVLLVLDAGDGRPLARRDLPVGAGADETFREFAVRPDGTVVYAHREESGVTLREYRLR